MVTYHKLSKKLKKVLAKSDEVVYNHSRRTASEDTK